jgi:hypothetical protein
MAVIPDRIKRQLISMTDNGVFIMEMKVKKFKGISQL